MKKRNYTVCTMLVLLMIFQTVTVFAQAPKKVSYQAVIRNTNGELVKSGNVGIKISILKGSSSGTVVYCETHTILSNVNGLITLEAGNGRTVTGTFSGINWGDGPFFLKVETDPSGGTSYTLSGISEILSTPYALYADHSATSLDEAYDNGDSIVADNGPFKVTGTDGVLFNGTTGEGTLPAINYGPYVLWYPNRSAFRAGFVYDTPVTEEYIGLYSTAFGYNTIAKGGTSFSTGLSTVADGEGSTALGAETSASAYYSTAMGIRSLASGYGSLATGCFTSATNRGATSLGYATLASGEKSTALGDSTIASGFAATATGFKSTASGRMSFAAGSYSEASGEYSVAMGYMAKATKSCAISLGVSNTASGIWSTAIGDYSSASQVGAVAIGDQVTSSGFSSIAIGCLLTASGHNSTAMGNYVSTNTQQGSFIIGDNSTTTPTLNTGWNQMMMRFDGGYQLYSSADLSTGVSIVNGKVGINKTSPTAQLEVNGNDGVVFGGTYGSGTIPASGAGTRLMWYPGKAAFRVGYVDGSLWDDSNIGLYSFATGSNTYAGGANSTAIGYYSSATTSYCTAIGTYSTASGNLSTAIGYNNIASGSNSTAMGSNVSTNVMSGSFIIGDRSTESRTNNTLTNQMMMRFANGYQLYTNSTLTTGVSLAAGGNSWSSISDSTKKENFLYSNGEYFLNSLSKLKLGSWNYKGQDAKSFRHYGPMAQEIFRYFGNDGKGTIGCDTLLSTADMDGIMMICLKALEQRTHELQEKTNEVETANKRLLEMAEANRKLEERVNAIEVLLRKLSDSEMSVSKQ